MHSLLVSKVGVKTSSDILVTALGENFVAGIPLGEFSFDLYDPSSNLHTCAVQMEEIGHGRYRASFVPDREGIWFLVIYHSKFIPAGNSRSIRVYSSSVDLLEVLVEKIKEIRSGRWKIDNEKEQLILYKDGLCEIIRVNIRTIAEAIL